MVYDCLLASWARYEDLQVSDKFKTQIQDFRYAWGKELKHILGTK